MLGASGVVLVVLVILVVAAALVWLIWFLKFTQLSRLRGALRAFERASENVPRGADLVALADTLKSALGDNAPKLVASTLGELADREGRFQLKAASSAIAELGRRGLLDIAKVRAAASEPIAQILAP